MPKKSIPATAPVDVPADIPGIDLPEVHSVVLPGGQPVAPAVAAQHDQAQIEAMRMAARQQAQRKAKRIGTLIEFNESFDTEVEDHWDFCVEIWKERFYLREMSKTLRKYSVKWSEETAKKLGITPAQMVDQSYLQSSLTPDQQLIVLDQSEEFQKQVLKFSLVKTSIQDRDFTGDNVVKLPRKVKEALVIWAQEGSELSEDDASFPESDDPQSA